MKKKLVYRYEHRIAEAQRMYEVAIPYIQKVVNSFERLGLGSVTTGELHEAVMDPQRFYYRRVEALIPEPATVGAFKPNKRKLADTLDLPKPFMYEQAAKETQYHAIYGEFNFGILEVVNETVRINATAWENLVESFTLYAEGEHELRFYDVYGKAIKALNDLETILRDEYNEELFNSLTNEMNTKYWFRHDENGTNMKPEVFSMVQEKNRRMKR